VTAALIGAIISAAVAVVVAVGNSWAVSNREQATRETGRRRIALEAIQDAALQLRGAQRRYGQALRTKAAAPPLGRSGLEAKSDVDAQLDPDLIEERDEAEGRLQMVAVRVADQPVIEAVKAWTEAAKTSFISIDDVDADLEQRAWNDLKAAIGAALTSDPPKQTRPRRRQAQEAAAGAGQVTSLSNDEKKQLLEGANDPAPQPELDGGGQL
jgi:hypothetical protein